MADVVLYQIEEECEKCHAKEVSFHTMQLRSADEGQTVFYHCLKCGYVVLFFCYAPIRFRFPHWRSLGTNGMSILDEACIESGVGVNKLAWK
jgi:hypothetical protein